jgi:hypothetical protein
MSRNMSQKKLTSYDNCIILKYIVALDCTFLLFYGLLVHNGMDCPKVKLSRYRPKLA